MTFGRLSQDNEITALRSSGVNLGSALVGPLVAAAGLAVGLTLFNNHVLPESNHAFANLLIDIGRMRPTARLQEGVFITDFPAYNLLVQSVNGRTKEMRGVTIDQMTRGGPPAMILAKRGFLSYPPDGRNAVLELRDGEIHEVPAEEAGARRYRRMVFKTHVIYIAGAGGLLERSVRNSRSDREMSARDLAAERASVVASYRESLARHRDRLAGMGMAPPLLAALAPERQPFGVRLGAALARVIGRGDPLDRLTRDQPAARAEVEMWRLERDGLRRRIASLSVEYHKKFSLPAACVVFVLIGAPLGMRVRRAGPAVAFVSIAFFLFYYLCLIGGEELANRLLLPPWLPLLLPKLPLRVLGLSATLKATRGGGPPGR